MTWANFKAGVANDFTNELVRTAPFKTGNLANSISYELTREGFRVSMARHGEYVEFGTAPHIIEVKNAEALHWKSGGEDHFAKRVHHPGTRPNPFIRNAFRQHFQRIVERNARMHL